MEKMKIISFMLFFTALNLIGQTLNLEIKNNLIKRINENTDYEVLDSINNYNVIEAISKLEENFWNQDDFKKGYFLIILNNLGSINVESMCNLYLDNQKNGTMNNNYHSQMDAFYISFLLSDFSHLDYYLNVLDSLDINNNLTAYLKPMEILINTEEHKIRIKPYIENILKFYTGKIDFLKWLKLYYKEYDDNELNLAKYLAENGSENTRGIIVKFFLRKSKDSNIVSFYKQRILNETSNIIQKWLLYGIIKDHPSPINHKFYKQIYNSLPEAVRTENSELNYNIWPPDDTVSAEIVIDSLTSYTNQCYGYEWLKDETYKNELWTKLANAENYLNAGDSLNCKTEITAFQNSVDLVYQNPEQNYPKYVSDEGYKFLYYYAGYIIERL